MRKECVFPVILIETGVQKNNNLNKKTKQKKVPRRKSQKIPLLSLYLITKMLFERIQKENEYQSIKRNSDFRQSEQRNQATNLANSKQSTPPSW